MYLPPHFRSQDRAQALDLIRENPLGTLVSNDDHGFPFVSHLPFHVEQRGEHLVLLGHCAKPNAQWRHLQQRPRAVVSFLGSAYAAGNDDQRALGVWMDRLGIGQARNANGG